jgi:hypothetical protein
MASGVYRGATRTPHPVAKKSGIVSDVAARLCQIRHHTAGDRIKHKREYDRYRAGRLLQRARGRRVVCEEHVRRERDQFCSLRGEGSVVSDRVAIIDVEVATDNPTEISKP